MIRKLRSQKEIPTPKHRGDKKQQLNLHSGTYTMYTAKTYRKPSEQLFSIEGHSVTQT